MKANLLQRVTFSLFFVVVTIYVIMGKVERLSYTREWIKPLPILLVLFYLQKIKHNVGTQLTTVQIAMFFGLLGDIFLALRGTGLYFKLGVLTFLIGNIIYSKILVSIMNSEVRLKHSKALIKKSLFCIYSLFLITFTVWSIDAVWEHLSFTLKLSVIVYAVFLVIKHLLAAYLYAFVKDQWLRGALFMLFLGTLLFYISDSMLVHVRLGGQLTGTVRYYLEFSTFFYFSGQFFIALGFAQYAKGQKMKKKQ